MSLQIELGCSAGSVFFTAENPKMSKQMDVVLYLNKARKGVAKTKGSSCLTEPDGDISCTSSVQGADFRCIRQEKDVLSNVDLSLSTVEVCSV